MGNTTVPNRELTTREHEFLRHYKKHLDQFGAPASMPIMARYLESSLSGAQFLRDSVIAKGYMLRVEPPARSKPNTLVRLKFTAKGKKAIG